MEETADKELTNLNFNDRSDSESTHSTPEDERIKRLFFTCDTNGDGFITYDDIRHVCIQLDMECCVDEVMQQLGTDANGKISYSEFVKRRNELLGIKSSESDNSEEYESTISESKEPLLEESSQTSSFEMYSNRSLSLNDVQAFGSQHSHSTYCNDNKGIWSQSNACNENESSGMSNTNSSMRHDSWEFDSGTHDLEIDTISLHKQIEASGIEMPSNINELLDLANKYYIESIHSIKQEKSKIHNKLQIILKEHQFLQKQILSLENEKILINKELEKKRLRERQRYEDKITELQSIICELSHNLNDNQFLTIKEEEETNSEENENRISSQNVIDSDLSEKLIKNQLISYSNKTGSKEKQRDSEWISCKTLNTNTESHSDDSHAIALEIDRLHCRITNLETQIELSALHLSQSKENAERLMVLIGKYEANNTAIDLALNYCEKALEVNQLLVSLLESEIGLVLANCRAAGLGKSENLSEKEEHEEVTRVYELANQKRKVAEELALNYIMKNNTNYNNNNTNFMRDDEIFLKDILQKLIHEKTIIKNSLTKIEPFIIDSDKDIKSIKDSNKTINIENIVLMEDFVSVKEMNASLRSQVYSLTKENSKLIQQLMKFESIRDNKCKNDGKQSEENGSISLDNNKIVNDLKKTNNNLYKKLDKTKKKYSKKVTKLEQKIAYISQRNSAQVKILQNKISVLENDRSLRKCIETTI